jgi:hypothetical protein
MADTHFANSSVKPKTPYEPQRSVDGPAGDFLWGAEEIAAIIGRSPRQTFNLLIRGQIRCARKVGGRWVASRSALLRELGGA